MTSDDSTTIHVEQTLPHPVERVWAALTTPSQLAVWLMPNDLELVVGHRFTMQGQPMEIVGFSGVVASEVLEVVPQQRLRLTWQDAHNPASLDSVVTFELTPEGEGTRLVVEQDGFVPDDERQQTSRRIMGGGWSGHLLRRLATLLDEQEEKTARA
ncbi:SRPBCC domain-containing protein [Tersicoccus sp. MR15.9]|uniref:SRPBCC family protein n=1 Tax=Tersicoccus mangrovi TaxID=3121635 RepID=UPI002FE5561E